VRRFNGVAPMSCQMQTKVSSVAVKPSVKLRRFRGSTKVGF